MSAIEKVVIRMKKTTLALFTIGSLLSCLLYVSALAGSEISAKGVPSTWVVDANGSGTFKTIQEAINHANPGDTIRVRNGTYYEQVSINKSISLVRDSLASPIIDGNGTGDVVSILADNVTIEGFTIRRGQIYLSHAGIRVEHSNHVVIRQNKIERNYRGIVFTSSNHGSVSDNIVSSNSIDGIGFFSSSNNVVIGNNISSNFVNGLTFYSSNNNSVVDNIVSHNSIDGITFSSSSNNLISHNTISYNNNGGITLSSSSNNIVSSNTISSNSVNGFILFLYSNNNVIYNNNFIHNTFQVLDDLTNFCEWSYNGEGNHWSDYKGKDLNGDGIGDEPYAIDSRNEDKYPLMGIFAAFSTTFKGRTYDIAIICNSTISGFRFEIGPETGNRIIQFNVTSVGGASGFCRITIPVELMNYSFIVMVGQKELTPTTLNISNAMFAHLYFTFMDGSQTVRIISSDTLRFYNELLDRNLELQNDLHSLNLTYNSIVSNYTQLLSNHDKLQENYRALNDSYQEHLSGYSESVQNLRNLAYIFAFVTGVLIMTVIYLSKRQRMAVLTETKTLDERK